MAGLKLFCIAVVSMLLVSSAVDAAVTCGLVVQCLTPCIPYARSSGAGSVPDGCCSGIRTLNTAASTTPDRRTACRCLKSIASAGFNYQTVAGIPGKCRVSLPYKISPATDCSNVI